jgi:hypothetical protein
MNAAIQTNPLYNLARSNQRATLFPVGQSDQAEINSMKLGSSPLRAYARRSNRLPVAAPAARRNFQTVWAAPVPAYAATA